MRKAVISIDYAYMGERDEGMPILVMIDRKSKMRNADVVPEKGANEYAVRRLTQNMDFVGYRNPEVQICKSDQEPALKALRTAVMRNREQGTAPEESPVGESQSNGEVENAVKMIQGMARVIKAGLERRLGKRIPRDHPIVPWIIRHAAGILNRRLVGKDGKTAHERARGRRWRKKGAEMGETVFYLKPRSKGKRPGRSWDVCSIGYKE